MSKIIEASNGTTLLRQCDDLFETVERSAAGMSALGDLMRSVNESHLNESTFSGIGHLLEVVSLTLIDVALEGYELSRTGVTQEKQPSHGVASVATF